MNHHVLPFDLEAAKAGAKIACVTRTGMIDAKFLLHIPQAAPGQRVLVLENDAHPHFYNEGGCTADGDGCLQMLVPVGSIQFLGSRDVPDGLGLTWEQAELRWKNGDPVEGFDVTWMRLESQWGGSTPNFRWPRSMPFRIPPVPKLIPWNMRNIPVGALIRKKGGDHRRIHLIIASFCWFDSRNSIDDQIVNVGDACISVYGDTILATTALADYEWAWPRSTGSWEACGVLEATS